MIPAPKIQRWPFGGRFVSVIGEIPALLLAGLVVLAVSEPLAIGQDDAGRAASRISPRDFPLPEGATQLAIDQKQQELRFETQRPIETTAKFFQQKMAASGWKPRFEQVASIFANLRYHKDGQRIEIAMKKEDIFKPTVSVTITGSGLAWKGGPVPASPGSDSRPAVRRPATPDATPVQRAGGIQGSDFPLLDAQHSFRNGSLELVTFRSRKTVAENVEYYDHLLAVKGWKKTFSKQYGDVRALRYENGSRYIRVGIWPHAFSDNAGSYQGTRGAVEGTGLIWSDSTPSGNVPERQLAEAERFLGKLSPAKRQYLLTTIRLKRESAFWPEGKMPQWAVSRPPGSQQHDGQDAQQPAPAEKPSAKSGN